MMDNNENELTEEYIKEQIEEYSRFLDTGIIDEACDDKEGVIRNDNEKYICSDCV